MNLNHNNLLFTLILSLSALNLQAQWQAYAPAFSDTLGVFDLRIAHGNDQVAWCVAMKYGVTPTTYTWEPTDVLYFAKTADGGNTWTAGTIPMGPEPYASNLCPVSASTAWASGVDLDYVSYVLRTDDGGVTWTRHLENEFVESSSYVDFVHFWDAQNGIAVGDPAVSDSEPTPFFEIYTTTDGGLNWDRIPSANIPAPDSDFGSSGLYQVRGDYVWFGTIDASTFLGKRLFRSKDRGQHWEVLDQAFESFGVFSFADTLHGITAKRISATEARLRYTADGGDTWTDLPSLMGAERSTSYAIVPQSNFIVVSRRDNNITGPFRTILSKDLGQTWMEIGIGENAATLQFSSPTVGYGGEWQPADHPTRMYKYNGSALSGLLSGQPLNARISVGPNPATDQVMVQFESPEPEEFILLLNNAEGRLIARKTVEKTTQGNVSFELGTLPGGIYTITVSNSTGSQTEKVVRQ